MFVVEFIVYSNFEFVVSRVVIKLCFGVFLWLLVKLVRGLRVLGGVLRGIREFVRCVC